MAVRTKILRKQRGLNITSERDIAIIRNATDTYWITGKPDPATRLCLECYLRKPLSYFDKDKNEESGLRAYCLECCEKVFPKLPYTYIIKAAGAPMVKIGKSFDPWKRLRDLQVGSSAILRLIAVTQEVPETAFHSDEYLGEYNAHGEWYHLTEGFVREFERIVEYTANGCYFSDIDFDDLL